jgi:ribosomal protein S18 acetylase RimI-like enzyme
MTEIIIRLATADDKEHWQLLNLKVVQETYESLIPAGMLEKALERTANINWNSLIEAAFKEITFLVAIDNSKIIGFIIAGPNRYEDIPGDTEIHAIYILKEYHKRGIGRQLMQLVANEIYISGKHSLCLVALETNPAVNFYKKLGGIRAKDQDWNIDEYTLNLISYVWNDIRILL